MRTRGSFAQHRAAAPLATPMTIEEPEAEEKQALEEEDGPDGGA
jgi:hypothetical protein